MKRGIYCVALYLLMTQVSQVQASYVLPYPSYMPGNKIYRVSRIADKVKIWISYGSIAQAKAHMALSDKYLVEAKTLYEYKQYLLATDALSRSNKEFEQIPSYIRKGSSERKDMSGVIELLEENIEAHTLVLQQIRQIVPSEFLWTPEKSNATSLPLHTLIDGSLSTRQSIADMFTSL